MKVNMDRKEKIKTLLKAQDLVRDVQVNEDDFIGETTLMLLDRSISKALNKLEKIWEENLDEVKKELKD